jgi:hypothetical protein
MIDNAVSAADFDRFAAVLRSRFASTTTGKMLTPAITAAYCNAVSRIRTIGDIRVTIGIGMRRYRPFVSLPSFGSLVRDTDNTGVETISFLFGLNFRMKLHS